jgi:hypothetical protein
MKFVSIHFPLLTSGEFEKSVCWHIVGKARLTILEYFEVISAHNCKINFSVHVKSKEKPQFASSGFTLRVFLNHVHFSLLSAARLGEHSFNFNITTIWSSPCMEPTNKADSKGKCAKLLASGMAVGTLSSFRSGSLEVCARSQPLGCRALSCPPHPAAALLPNITNQAQLRCQHPIFIVCPCVPLSAYSTSIQVSAWLTVRDSSHTTFHLFSMTFVDLLVLIVPHLFNYSNEVISKPFFIAPRLVSECRREHDG